MKAQREIFLLIEDIYGTVGDDERWLEVLRSLRANLNATACALVGHDFDARSGVIRAAAGIAPPYLVSYRDRYAALNPWLRRETYYRRAGAVWTSQELAPRGELVASEFYRGWLRPQDFYHQSCAVLHWACPEAVFLATLRPAGAGAFDRRELELYDIVVPHLRQAIEFAGLLAGANLGGARRRGQEMQDAVADVPGALMVVGQDERLLAASEQAERLLAAGRPFRARRGHLRLAPGSGGDGGVFHRHVETALRTASGAGLAPGGEMPLSDAAEAKVVPLPTGALPGQDQPAVAVVVDDRVPSEDRLRQLYGLTRAEARLAAHLARGLSVQETAERLGVGLTTARTHLQRVYGKTDTNRQAELVALLLGAAKRDEH